MPKILLVDDHDIVLEGLASVISRRPEWQVVGQVRSREEALHVVGTARPDVAIIDFNLGDSDGVSVMKECLALWPRMRVLIFTMHENEAVIGSAIAAGARGFIFKSDGGRSLSAALDAMEADEPYFPGLAGEVLLRAYMGGPPEPFRTLTPRERDVSLRIARGLSGKKIAADLSISPKTVEVHRSAIMRKLGVKNAVELANYVLRSGFGQA